MKCYVLQDAISEDILESNIPWDNGNIIESVMTSRMSLSSLAPFFFFFENHFPSAKGSINCYQYSDHIFVKFWLTALFLYFFKK